MTNRRFWAFVAIGLAFALWGSVVVSQEAPPKEITYR